MYILDVDIPSPLNSLLKKNVENRRKNRKRYYHRKRKVELAQYLPW